jgi:hypothetical protein
LSHATKPGFKYNYFDPMLNEQGVSSDWLWRPAFSEVCMPWLCALIIGAITAAVNVAYPCKKWVALSTEFYQGQRQTRNYLQINTKPGTQPLHFDSGARWYKDEHGNMWAPLSTITNINDGAATFLTPQPVHGVFAEVEKKARAKDFQGAATFVQDLLTQLSVKHQPFRTMPNRAGQVVAFHPGDQPHAGMGFDGPVEGGLNDFVGRIMLYLFFVPEEYSKEIIDHELFSAEYA